MNITQLESPPVSELQRFAVDATEKDANFLSFRQLNKRARVRLSPTPFAQERLQVKSNLFSAAHSKGWFAAAIHETSGFSLIFAPLADLRATFASSGQNDEIPFAPQRTLGIAPAMPNIMTFASHDSRMLLSLTNGQILVYDTSTLFTSGSDTVLPLHSFPSRSSSAPRQILPNPGDMPDLIALLREPGASQSVEILDVQKMETVGGWYSGNTPDTTPTSLSWSPKGKQLAVGLLSGDILTFSPSATGTLKLRLPPLLSPTNEPQTLVSTTWLSNPTFHVIYAPPTPQDAERSHFVVTQDAVSSALSSSKFTLPIYSMPGLSPSPFTLILRNWDPVKTILLIGDRSSSDIGVIGSIGDDWHTFSLEETATPRLPLDKDGNETLLLALEIDLSSPQTLQTSIAGEDVELPPPPVMYAYASDGTVQGWYIVNAQGTTYPGMMPISPTSPSQFGSSIRNPSSVAASTSLSPPQPQAVASSFDSTSFGAVKPAAGFGAFGSLAQPVSAFGKSEFDAKPSTPFGQSSFPTTASSSGGFGAFGSPTSAFGKTGFDAKPTTAFGQSSFPTASATTAPSSGGFGAFASGGLSAFGTASQSSANAKPAWSTDSGSAFATGNGESNKNVFGSGGNSSAFGGGSVFGNSQDAPAKPNTTVNALPPPSSSPGPRQSPSPFGVNINPPDHSSNKPASSFGSTGFGAIKPAEGFGAFGSLVQPTSAFGRSAFDAKPAAAFGQSSFPTTPATIAPSSGGFGAFASGGLSAFGTASQGANAKPAWSTDGGSAFSTGNGESNKNVFGSGGGSSAFAGGSVFGNKEPSQDTPVKPNTATSTFSFPSPSSSPEPRQSPSLVGVNDSPPVSPSPMVPPSATGSSPFGSSANKPASFFGSGAIKPAAGFGAFGSPVQPTSPFGKSAFDVKPSTAFGQSSFPTTPATTAPSGGGSEVSKPVAGFEAFGSLVQPASAFGKSGFDAKPSNVFGQSSFPATPATITAPSSGGFGAFASGGPATFGVASQSDANAKPAWSIHGSSVFAAGNGESDKNVFGSGGSSSAFGGGSVFGKRESSQDTSVKPSIVVPSPSSPLETRRSPSPSPSGDDSSPVIKPVSSFSSTVSVSREPSQDTRVEPSVTVPSSSSSPESRRSPSPSEASDSSPDHPANKLASSFGSAVFVNREPSQETSVKPSATVPSPSSSPESRRSPSPFEATDRSPDHPAHKLASSFGSAVFVTREPSSDTPVKQNVTGLSPSPSPEHRRSPSPSPSGVDDGSPASKPASPFGSTVFVREPSQETTVKPNVTALSPLPSPEPRRSPPSKVNDNLPDHPANKLASSLGSTVLVTREPSQDTPVKPSVIVPSPSFSPEPQRSPSPSEVNDSPPVSPSSPFGASSPTVTTFGQHKTSNKEVSTTPSGSPDKGTSPPSQKSPLPAPAPVLPSMPFGAGLSRPGTRFGAKPTTFTTDIFSSKPKGSPSPLAQPPFVPGDLTDAKPTIPVFSNPVDRKAASPSPHPPTQRPTFFSTTPPPVKAAVVRVEPTLEQGMQAECLHLLSSLGRELEDLRELAQQASKKRTELGQQFGGSRHSGSRDHTKWTIGDFGQMKKELKKDIRLFTMQRDTQLQAIRELEGHMLKAGTRKEEIARFNKAKTDVEFAKMLKSRTLGPEHLETQSQLRRNITTIRDRVQKLEDHLQASKKKLSQMKTGTPGLKAPSLDTINRTYRNIDIAIEQQAQEVANLTSMMAKLDVTSALHLPSTRDKRLPDTRTRRPANVTPHVAISTAAALNAERSAQELKLALLAVRKEPLLNTEAISASAPVVFVSPQKPNINDHSLLLAWSSPDLNESPTHTLSSRRTTKRHLPPIALKRSPASQPVAPPNFDWGPLPSITPMKTISADVRRKDEVQQPLGGSWVADDFRQK